jgi:hypothetical protein
MASWTTNAGFFAREFPDLFQCRLMGTTSSRNNDPEAARERRRVQARDANRRRRHRIVDDTLHPDDNVEEEEADGAQNDRRTNGTPRSSDRGDHSVAFRLANSADSEIPAALNVDAEDSDADDDTDSSDEDTMRRPSCRAQKAPSLLAQGGQLQLLKKLGIDRNKTSNRSSLSSSS